MEWFLFDVWIHGRSNSRKKNHMHPLFLKWISDCTEAILSHERFWRRADIRAAFDAKLSGSVFGVGIRWYSYARQFVWHINQIAYIAFGYRSRPGWQKINPNVRRDLLVGEESDWVNRRFLPDTGADWTMCDHSIVRRFEKRSAAILNLLDEKRSAGWYRICCWRCQNLLRKSCLYQKGWHLHIAFLWERKECLPVLPKWIRIRIHNIYCQHKSRWAHLYIAA